MRNYRNFHDYMVEKFMDYNPMIFDDDIPDRFDDWISDFDPAEMMLYADDYANLYKNKGG